VNIKLVLLGGIAYFLIAQIIGAISGPLVHGPGGALEATYQMYSAMWRPELNATPPDLMALMPLWLTTAAINSLIVAAVFDLIRPSLPGGAVAQGLRFGITVGLIMVGLFGLYFGIFALPAKVWIFWGVEGLLTYSVGGIGIAAVGNKFAPASD